MDLFRDQDCKPLLMQKIMKHFALKEGKTIYQLIKWGDDMENKNYNKIINLLDQMIEFNHTQDLKREKESDTGQSFNLFHLKLLKELITDGKE